MKLKTLDNPNPTADNNAKNSVGPEIAKGKQRLF
jgi:hypothetical protein